MKSLLYYLKQFKEIEMKIYEYSATEIAEKIRKKEITATEVIEQLNERIKKVDDKIGAYVDINLQTALEMAKKSR